MEPLPRRVRRSVPRGDRGPPWGGPAHGPRGSLAMTIHSGRSQASICFLFNGAPTAPSTALRPPRGPRASLGRPGARPAWFSRDDDSFWSLSGFDLSLAQWSPSRAGYGAPSPEGTAGLLGAARRTARVVLSR